ncbi:hypothetical protein GN244_ATG13669 [Phytophthora infestans]|uniref:Uncharacterized protein n=1 Tax=Phytophthora infestans TaxID=4787 RepID=A0A833SH01_PHYIN|nr:hypothetical protein GN244_ATG13669 [Phytophthora infestans]KAF4147050.1 hypothetical protein GN958_ATG03770 [Phytophthora infestans]
MIVLLQKKIDRRAEDEDRRRRSEREARLENEKREREQKERRFVSRRQKLPSAADSPLRKLPDRCARNNDAKKNYDKHESTKNGKRTNDGSRNV